MPANLECLWQNPDQAGVLYKQAHSNSSLWQPRFFVLKGSSLYYFKDRRRFKRLHGVIPLEGARIEGLIEGGHCVPGSPSEELLAEERDCSSKHQTTKYITITLHVQHAYFSKHSVYTLMTADPQVHVAWIAALTQGSIPRTSLLDHLTLNHGAMDLVFKESSELKRRCFPTKNASVLSCSASIRMLTSIPDEKNEDRTKHARCTEPSRFHGNIATTVESSSPPGRQARSSF